MMGSGWGRVAAVALFGALAGAITYASADYGPELSWEPEKSSAILSPANDTRSNLLLLLADRHGTQVADPQQMRTGIVPIEFSWNVMSARLRRPMTDEERSGSWEEPDGTRCHSNETGAAAFVAAVSADEGIPAQEKAALVQGRQELKTQCGQAANGKPMLNGIDSRPGISFATYLVAARLFYGGELVKATDAFQGMAQSSQPWVRETATYMIARSALNHAQISSFSKYGDLEELAKRDIAAIEVAGRAFETYLRAYPQGRYAESARGLMRRVAWLKGDEEALGTEYGRLLSAGTTTPDGEPNVELIEEIDLKLLPAVDSMGMTDPLLLAVIDLTRLRQDQSDGGVAYIYGHEAPKLELAELERQRPYFKSEPALFEYLLAVEAFYGRKQPQEVLGLIPDAAHQQRFSYVQFSRQMLRGFALEAVKDHNARGFWLSLLLGAVQPYQRGAVELALAEHDRAAGQVTRLFAAESPLSHPLIRQRVLEKNAGPTLLRQQARAGLSAHERDVSLYLLLAGEIHHGLYADFLKDAAMVGRPGPKENEYYGQWSVNSYNPAYNDELARPPLSVFEKDGSNDLSPCPNIRATVTSLSTNPAAIRPRLCLAEFIRRKDFDGWNDNYQKDTHLTRAGNGFPGKPLERIDVYRSVIVSPAASADDKAFALNRAIRCFAPTGHSTCGGDEISQEQRRGWFNQLKRDYPQSSWARDLKFYW